MLFILLEFRCLGFRRGLVQLLLLANEPRAFMIRIAESEPDGDEGVYRITTGSRSSWGYSVPGGRVPQVKSSQDTWKKRQTGAMGPVRKASWVWAASLSPAEKAARAECTFSLILCCP